MSFNFYPTQSNGNFQILDPSYLDRLTSAQSSPFIDHILKCLSIDELTNEINSLILLILTMAAEWATHYLTNNAEILQVKTCVYYFSSCTRNVSTLLETSIRSFLFN